MNKLKIVLSLALTVALGVSCCSCGSNTADVVAGAESTSTDTMENDVNNLQVNMPDITQLDVDKYIVKLADYKGIETDGLLREITDEEVQKVIQLYFDSCFVTEKSDKSVVEDGDIVNIDYEGIKDGVILEEGSAQGYELIIGSGTFIPGFEEGLIGATVGNEVELNITFPELYSSEELAGETVIFSVKVNYIGEKVLNPSQLNQLSQWNVTNEDELADYVRRILETDANNTYVDDKVSLAIAQLIEKTEFTEDIPAELYEAYREQTQNYEEQMASNVGMTWEEYVVNYIGIDEMEYEKIIDEFASDQVKRALVLEKIRRLENITVSEEEYEQQLAVDAAGSVYESVEDYMAGIDIQDYKNNISIQKVKQYLYDMGYIK